ncbi:MAG TPA: TraR/DksA C4-type zinc finger protein, partial [Candidatus Paceibacterota bacterium]|nr:TraR/DksA C4-type zinc finger protein [Candidatus Paceibacterota bacterium]
MKKQGTIDTAHFKKMLEKELASLEVELKSVGHKNAENPKDWEPGATDVDVEASDLADTADNIENYELNTAILKPLETQYNDVKLALEKIKKGTYGLCEVDGKPIEKARLEANPAARTCLEHTK